MTTDVRRRRTSIASPRKSPEANYVRVDDDSVQKYAANRRESRQRVRLHGRVPLEPQGRRGHQQHRDHCEASGRPAPHDVAVDHPCEARSSVAPRVRAPRYQDSWKIRRHPPYVYGMSGACGYQKSM